ncbi:hypothetical protein [Acetobacter senegalensis]|uniref:hypothetical protein n=1 Tax=Acetobacter senegalensis TaxID=446692 RepID=UPI00264EB431|nr:hypothetical protein [Acetobacter senegalensis]MDN7356357.1 hypothetical protein [Acetobacter senegalensis]
MTTPTNWPNPEQPGVPMFPERDGWHWLSNSPNGDPFPAEWRHEDYCDAETEWFWDMGEEWEDAHEMRGLYYRGLCPLPGAANETACVALNNIATLTEQARKNIAIASGSRKMAKALSQILADIDKEVKAVRNVYAILTPAQIAEMLAAERERCAKICDAIATSASNEWKATAYDSDNRAGEAAEETAEICAQKIRNPGAAP